MDENEFEEELPIIFIKSFVELLLFFRELDETEHLVEHQRKVREERKKLTYGLNCLSTKPWKIATCLGESFPVMNLSPSVSHSLSSNVSSYILVLQGKRPSQHLGEYKGK